MHIAFLDCIDWSYGMDAPFTQPMGGTNSAICYLAVELARLGHTITVYNGTVAPAESCGVHLRNLRDAQSPGHLNTCDVVVVSNHAIGRLLRRDSRVTVPMVLWTSHAHDQPQMRELTRLNERKCWNGFAFVSHWQRECYEKFFWTPREKGRVLRNAVSPAFVDGDHAAPWFVTGEPPTLFYTSTPSWARCFADGVSGNSRGYRRHQFAGLFEYERIPGALGPGQIQLPVRSMPCDGRRGICRLGI